MTPQALLFDVFGTCVDWRSGVAAAVTQMAKSKNLKVDSLAFADSWRARYQPSMEAIRSGQRSYTELDILHRENLAATLEEFGIADTLTSEETDKLNRSWEQLPPWPDTITGLIRLKKKFIIAPCSNGSMALITRLGKFAGLPWDCVLGAGLARAYKPDRQAYQRSCAALQLEPAQVMMVAAHNDDLAAARALGMATLFIVRKTEYGPGQTTDLKPEQAWDIIADDLRDAADKIGA